MFAFTEVLDIKENEEKVKKLCEKNNSRLVLQGLKRMGVHEPRFQHKSSFLLLLK